MLKASSPLDDHLRAIVVEAVAEALRAHSQSPAIEPKLLTVEQAAQYLGRSTGAMRQLKRSGKIPIVQFDGRIFFDRQDLDRIIEEAKR